ncbi:MAG: thiol-disulfide oxidoreductase DCC family protein [Bacteroidota bacterium]|nr:thiol-disulfide oxidoreductase DCC family protein [Bacteroidota bacterium]
MPDQPVILFDGFCNFCNSAVNFVIKRDKKGIFKFAALQSDISCHLLNKFESPRIDLNSFVLIENDKIFTRSTAALKVCKHLSGLWPLMYGFMIVPGFIRDSIYNWISKNRYKWFGKREECMIPTSAISTRFLKINI